MRKLKFYFLFYKTNFIAPLLITLTTLLVIKIITIAIITLAVSSVGIWFYKSYILDRKKTSVCFYLNFGISEMQLHLFMLAINFVLLIFTNKLLE